MIRPDAIKSNLTRSVVLLTALLLAGSPAWADATKWQAFLVAGESALTKKDFDEAEKLFRAALREASIFEKADERRGITLNHLATTLNAQRHYGNAEPVLLQAMAVWDEQPPSNELHLATTLHHLAGIYHARGEFEAAAEPLVRALAIRERFLPADHPALRHTRKSMAALGSVLGDDHYTLQSGKAQKKTAKAAKAEAAKAKPVALKAPEEAAPVRLSALIPKAEPEAAPKKKAPAAKAPETKAPETKAPEFKATEKKKPAKQTPVKAKAAKKQKKTGRYLLHLASFKSEAAANQAWARLRSNHSELLGDLGLTLQSADLGEQGTFKRLLAGPVQKTDGRDLCKQLKGKGLYCALVPNQSADGQLAGSG